ncbi:methyltransferase regulatory domain-containing protein [Paraliomyxa miuraensis]|uniref:methyltransferase regulatory domain-containing protein n=1 Tax=Paraliomyxa miuraensis TaxID=376150 RepID=UPI00224ECF1F|nr:class I SAM-dependent methyltransferase [Paraliomyxa miuraensis]MCX4240628.1 class I SAM-dependent methyltransferase [Paraliomyxa miuraensis]
MTDAPEPLDGYDQVPYTSYPYPQSHPDRLHVVASLFGARPALASGCRVLELGCGSGGNLLPMAELLPGSELVGVDRSRRQIELGRELAAEAGLTNVELRRADLMDVDASWGTFDFILCHGVYSWVPARVQDKILEILRDHLRRPDGIGYVSYNVYPGWHLREMVRHMMRYHVRELTEPAVRVEQAKALLGFLSENVSDGQGPYGASLLRELRLLRALPDDYLYHEHLEDDNEPIYFYQFAERLAAHRLQYVGETDLQTMIARGLAPEVEATLDRIAPDLLTREQYMDFVRNRQFRATVICHEGVTLRRELGPSAAQSLSFELLGRPKDGAVDLTPGLPQVFVGPGEVEMTTSTPLTKAALLLLQRAWPRALSVDVLFQRASSLVREAGLPAESGQEETLASDLLWCSFGGAVGVRRWVPPVAAVVPARPRASRVARAQARRGDFVASLHHQLVRLDRAPRQLILRLDGEHDQERLCAVLTELVIQGELELTLDGRPLRERASIRAPLAHVVEQTLAKMVGQALLLAEDA